MEWLKSLWDAFVDYFEDHKWLQITAFVAVVAIIVIVVGRMEAVEADRIAEAIK